MVRDGPEMRLYLDGVEDAVTISNATGNVDYDTQITMGQTVPTGSARSFDGRMDEVAIYDRALSATEVEEHF